MKIFLFCLVVLFFSCNVPAKSDNETSEPQKSAPAIGENELMQRLYTRFHSNPSTQQEVDENLIIEYAVKNNLNVERTQRGVYYIITEEGEGENIQYGDKLTVHYKGYFTNDQEFDSSYSRGEPINFKHGRMNKGWNNTLGYFKKSSKGKILIPSHMGYGEKGFPGYVDPNTVILFDVHILDVQAKNPPTKAQ